MTAVATKTCGRCGGEFEPASSRVKNCTPCTAMLQAAQKADIYRPVADALAAAVAEGITGDEARAMAEAVVAGAKERVAEIRRAVARKSAWLATHGSSRESLAAYAAARREETPEDNRPVTHGSAVAEIGDE